MTEYLERLEPVVKFHAATVAARYRLGDVLDDLEQEGRKAVLVAAPRYDGSTEPQTFFAPRIRGAMLDAVRGGLVNTVRVPRSAVARGVTMLRRRHDSGFRGRLGDESVSCADFWAAVASTTDPEHADDPAAEFRAWLKGRGFSLRAADAEFLVNYFVRGKTLREMGTGRGVSEAAASYTLERIAGELRKQHVRSGGDL
jgi:RNA polymerase sigma factor (sigma-70 family)